MYAADIQQAPTGTPTEELKHSALKFSVSENREGMYLNGIRAKGGKSLIDAAS